jgi:hypothetical protein
MRSKRLLGVIRRSTHRGFLVLTAALSSIALIGCSSDAPTEPLAAGRMARLNAGADANTILVTTSAELTAALTPENAGRRVHVRAGSYDLTQLLTVPDQMTLEGDGVMLFDEAGLPTGFAAGTRTTLTMTTNSPGDVLSLGNGASVRGLAIEDRLGRIGNVIGVVSRSAGDAVSAAIDETEIVNPNGHIVVPAGPAGCGVAVLTQNPNLGADPPAHEGAVIAAQVTRSLIHSLSAGTGCALFAFNFAALGSVSVTLDANVLGGGIIAQGGVSRPDPVHDSRTTIQSRRNLYRNDSPDLCTPQRFGWNVGGGSGTPVPLPIGETTRNALRIHSVDDRLEGFTTGILATGGRRFFGSPTAGATTGNSADLELIGTTITTPACGGAPYVSDLQLAGALVGSPSLVPGDGNTLRAVIRGVTGSGSRSNVYADVMGLTGPVAAEFQGIGNRLDFVGNPQSFGQTNRAIDPAPGAEFFH